MRNGNNGAELRPKKRPVYMEASVELRLICRCAKEALSGEEDTLDFRKSLALR